MSDNQNIINQILQSINSCVQSTSNINQYTIILILSSIFFIFLYIYRYKKISKDIPKGYSEDLKSLTIIIICLCVWNIILTIFSGSILINLGRISHFLSSSSISNLSKEINGFFITNESNVTSEKNYYFFTKDLRFFFIAIISMILFQFFSQSISKSIEYISFLKSSSFYYHVPNDTNGVSLINEDDIEKLMASTKNITNNTTNNNESKNHSRCSSLSSISSFQSTKPKKTVSFDSTLTTFNYSDLKLSIIKNSKSLSYWNIILPTNNFKKNFGKKIISFSLILFGYTIILPEKLFMNSSSFLYINQSSNYTVKFDHIFFTIITMFLIDVFSKFIMVANHPNFKNFPHLTSMACHFTWCYCCIILSCSITCSILLSDTLINVIGLMIQAIINFKSSHSKITGSSPPTVATISNNSINPLNFFTSILINYLEHSVILSSCSNSVTTTTTTIATATTTATATLTTTTPHIITKICSNKDYIDTLTNMLIWIKIMLTNCWIVTNFTCLILLPFFIWVLIIELKIGYNKSAHF